SEARRDDPDRYLTAIFAPADCRASVLGLILFNHELARVPAIASEPVIGMIRYQWWRDALEEAAEGRPRRHPVVEALATAFGAHHLSAADLTKLIDAREVEIDRLQPENLDALETFVASTSGYLSELIDGAVTGGAWREPARLAGTAYGLVGIVRAVRAQIGQDRLLLPADGAVAPILERAASLLHEMRRLAGKAPRRAATPLLLATIARRQLKQSQRNTSGPPTGEAGPQPFLPLELLLRSWGRRY
ncbi:MAG: squalene/phytoene synthase family protein, partial [Pseudomonadota bacterium]